MTKTSPSVGPLRMFVAGLLSGLVIYESINNTITMNIIVKRSLSSNDSSGSATTSVEVGMVDRDATSTSHDNNEYYHDGIGSGIDNDDAALITTPPKFNWKAYYEDNPKLTIVKMGGKVQTGAGSQICNLIAYKIYVNDLGRNFAVDTTPYYMQYNDNIGFLGGWFSPTFPLVQNTQDQQQLAYLFEQYEDALPNSTVPATVEEKKSRMREARAKGEHVLARKLLLQASRMSPPKNNYYAHVDQNKDGLFVLLNPATTFRDQKFFKKYPNEGNAIYQRFAAEACANFQFNKHAIHQFDKVKRDHGIPNFRSLVNSSSVAFHVRRGDKLTAHESLLYPGKDYVKTLLNALDTTTTNAATTIEHCFVATDDFAAVREIRDALVQKGIDCTLHSLTMKSQRGHITDGNNQYDEIVQFLTEVSMLVDATYFVGTFDSNVGSLVALLRSCVHVGTPHYHHSYGVDRDHWVFR